MNKQSIQQSINPSINQSLVFLLQTYNESIRTLCHLTRLTQINHLIK